MASTDLDDLDEFSDLDFGEEDSDEFADLDEYTDPEPTYNPNAIDLGKPMCETCGNGEAIAGPSSRSECQRCNQPWVWDQTVIAETKPRNRKDETPRPIMSGHCGSPQTSEPHLSHERCALLGGGSRANPEKRFHPCPCTCHLAHAVNENGSYGEVETFDCGGCSGLLAEAPVFGVDEDGDPIYVHVNRKNSQMIYSGPCR